jgi:hypothetical protein
MPTNLLSAIESQHDIVQYKIMTTPMPSMIPSAAGRPVGLRTEEDARGGEKFRQPEKQEKEASWGAKALDLKLGPIASKSSQDDEGGEELEQKRIRKSSSETAQLEKRQCVQTEKERLREEGRQAQLEWLRSRAAEKERLREEGRQAQLEQQRLQAAEKERLREEGSSALGGRGKREQNRLHSKLSRCDMWCDM